jgi:hypothetical protein
MLRSTERVAATLHAPQLVSLFQFESDDIENDVLSLLSHDVSLHRIDAILTLGELIYIYTYIHVYVYTYSTYLHIIICICWKIYVHTIYEEYIYYNNY